MSTFYVGLAATLHDPAIAVVDDRGRVVFAEACERALQDKRAFNCPPDHLIRTPRLLRDLCGDAAELVLALSWSGSFLNRLRIASVADVRPFHSILGPLRDAVLRRRDHLVRPFPDFVALCRGLQNSLEQAGLNLRWRGARLRGAPRRFDHHLTHAATACWTAPFDSAACAIVDGFGEWSSSACFRYEGGRLERLSPSGPWGSRRRASLGMLYGLVCEACGFDMLAGEEWKVMGLAPYGRHDPKLWALLEPMVRVDGLELVTGCSPAEYRQRADRLLALRRPPGSSPMEAADLAFTGQEIFGAVMRAYLNNVRTAVGSENLVLGGGCALNSAWNGKILEQTSFRQLHVPSAPADDGCALGSALLALQEDRPATTPDPSLRQADLGSGISAPALERAAGSGALRSVEHLPGTLIRRVAELLSQGRLVGWMQGRAEFGPRALGHRSILADPRSAEVKQRVNAAAKFRESYRPFAPAILHEHGAAWFEDYQESPYMERTLRFLPEVRARVPAVVHVDGTGRLQSVSRDRSPRFHRLLSEFHQITGVPILLNTSFNVMGRPMVHSVEDALAAFLTTDLDALAIEDHLFLKT